MVIRFREILNYRKDGTQFWTDLSISPTRNGRGALVGFVGILADLTERKCAEATRIQAESSLSSIVQHMPGFLFRRVRKPDGAIQFTFFSPSFARLIGRPEGFMLTGAALWQHIHPEDVEKVRRGIDVSAQDLSPLVVDFRVISEGMERWFRSYSSPQQGAGGDVIWEGVGIDVTPEKVGEIRLNYLAYHDKLTGLANRVLLAEQLGLAIAPRANVR